MVDHDQRFKTLLSEFLGEFFEEFFPQWYPYFDFTAVEFLTTETYIDLIQGEKIIMDLVAKLPLLDGSGSEIAIIHIEIESVDTMVPIQSRMPQFYEALRGRYGLPVLPVVLFLQVGGDGLGHQMVVEEFHGYPIRTFQYPYIGLPALKADEYRDKSNLLSAALSVLMKQKRADRPANTAKIARRVIQSTMNDKRKELLYDCARAYGPLDKQQQLKTDELIRQTSGEAEMAQFEMFAEWKQAVREEGEETGERKLLTKLLVNRFGPLSESIVNRLRTMSVEEIENLGFAMMTANSLEELGLTNS